MTTVFDAAGEGSAKACWALMRRARADKLESASSAAKPLPFQAVALCRPEKPDMYWSAPPGPKRPVISAAEIGYVRRSEFISCLTRRRLIVPYAAETRGKAPRADASEPRHNSNEAKRMN